jgi:CRP-like cAMP-binding protein
MCRLDPDRLREIPLFASLSDEALLGIAPFVRESSVPAGSVVLKEGDFAYELMAIQEGEADVLRGHRRVATLGPGDFFGEIAVLDKTLRTASVVARTPLRLVSLSRWHLRRVGSAIDEIRATAEERSRYGEAATARESA